MARHPRGCSAPRCVAAEIIVKLRRACRESHCRDARFDMSRVAPSRMFCDMRRRSRAQFVKAPLERLVNHVTLLRRIVGHSDIPTIWIKGT